MQSNQTNGVYRKLPIYHTRLGREKHTDNGWTKEHLMN